MKREKIIPITIIAVVVIVMVAAGVYFAVNPAAWQQVLAQMDITTPEAGRVIATGFTEAEQASISP